MIGYDAVLRGLIMTKSGNINHLGLDLDDLKNTVDIHLWEKGLGELLARPLAYVMAKNKLIDVHRKDVCEERNKRLTAPLLLSWAEVDVEREVFTTEAVELLRVALVGDQWETLRVGLEQGFNKRDMWLSEGTSMSYSNYAIRFNRLILHCRAILHAAKIYSASEKTINKVEV